MLIIVLMKNQCVTSYQVLSDMYKAVPTQRHLIMLTLNRARSILKDTTGALVQRMVLASEINHGTHSRKPLS